MFITSRRPQGGKPVDIKQMWGIEGCVYAIRVGYCPNCSETLYINDWDMIKIQEAINDILSNSSLKHSLKHSNKRAVGELISKLTGFRNHTKPVPDYELSEVLHRERY